MSCLLEPGIGDNLDSAESLDLGIVKKNPARSGVSLTEIQ